MPSRRIVRGGQRGMTPPGQGRPFTRRVPRVVYDRWTQGQADARNQWDLISSFLNYETPESEQERMLNTLQQILSSQQTQSQRSFQQSQAARTGGRLGSTSRGTQEIGGQFALAGQIGADKILTNLKK